MNAHHNLVSDRETLAGRFPQLSSKQLSFVAVYVANGGKGTHAAKEAGYATASAHVEAHRQLQKPSIIKAIAELTVQRLGAAMPGAVATIERLSERAKSEYVQLEASKDLLDRAGLSAPKRVNIGGDLRVTFDLT